jgi:Rod binding domain-containing protein
MNSIATSLPTTPRGTSDRIPPIPTHGLLTHHQKLVQQARKWVAMSFFEPMLKQMRESPFHSDLLDGGEGGKAFASMYDERLSERMASDASDTLVKSIVRKIEGGKAYAAQAQQDINSEREGADRAQTLSTTGAGHVASHY